MNELMALALFLVAVDWLVAALLGLAAFLPPRVAGLTERAFAALAIASACSIGWLLIDNVRGGTPLPAPSAQLIGVVLLVLVSLPALWWLAQFLRGRFR